MTTLVSDICLTHKSNLAARILEELKASIQDFNPDEFEELINKYRVEDEVIKCSFQKEKPKKK